MGRADLAGRRELAAQTLSGVASLALPGMLFEIDAVAVRPAGRDGAAGH